MSEVPPVEGSQPRESHRARALRHNEDRYPADRALVHALLAIEERLDLIACALGNISGGINTRRLDADDTGFAADA